jgi:hypothetical protein
MPSSPPPDRFQREIDDIIRLAERRLEHQSFSYRMKRSTRRLGNALGGFQFHLPAAEVLGGWAMALLLIGWLLSLPLFPPLRVPGGLPLSLIFTAVGIVLLVLAIVKSLMRGRSGGGGGGHRMWRGERLAYSSPYGASWLDRLRRVFRGR